MSIQSSPSVSSASQIACITLDSSSIVENTISAPLILQLDQEHNNVVGQVEANNQKQLEKIKAVEQARVHSLQVDKRRLDALEQLLNKTGQLTERISDMLCQSRARTSAAVDSTLAFRKRKGLDPNDPTTTKQKRNTSLTSINITHRPVRRAAATAATAAIAATEREEGPEPIPTPLTLSNSTHKNIDPSIDTNPSIRRSVRQVKATTTISSSSSSTITTTTPLPSSQLNQNSHSFPSPVSQLNAEQIASRRYHSMFKGQLKPYQLEGVEWLYTLFDNGLNGILADEMGLGKTVQTIAFLCRIRATVHLWGVSLVVAPLSTLANWEAEFARFAPDINVFLYHGSRDERMAMKDIIKRLLNKSIRASKSKPTEKYTREQILQDRMGAPVILTSYEMINNKYDTGFFRSLSFITAVIDEGHRLKNSESILFHNLRLMNTATRYLLTGTPLQNSLAELWSLLNFVMPLVFNDVDSFLGWFDFELEGSKLNRTKILSAQLTNGLVTKMHAILSPFMLRRIKTDVNLSLPPKKELVVVASLTREQLDLFRALKINATDTYFAELFASSGLPPPNPMQCRTMINLPMALRRICCHPFLFPHPEYPIEYEYEPSIVTRSGKMMLLDQLLHELLIIEKDQHHKVLVFSQFTDVLTIIQYYLEGKQWGHTRLDGGSGHLERKSAIHDFHTNPHCQIFLLTTRAGGLGLNLTEADTVILFDSDYNPQNDLQAMDRAHRLGQRRPVTVFRFLSELEWRVYDRAQAKRRLEKMVIGQGQLHNKYGQSTIQEDITTNTPIPMGNDETDDAEQAAKQFTQMLEQLLNEEDGETIRVLEEGEEAIQPHLLNQLLHRRAKWDGVTESTELKDPVTPGKVVDKKEEDEIVQPKLGNGLVGRPDQVQDMELKGRTPPLEQNENEQG